MTLMKTKPSKRDSWLSDLFNADDFFARSWPSIREEASVPPVNVRETSQEYILEIATPGMEKEDLRLEMRNGVLVIEGHTQREDEEEKEGEFTRREFSYQSFTRTFTLPEDVVEADIAANFKSGLLTVTLPRNASNPDKTGQEISIS